jgi:hypothetical protein
VWSPHGCSLVICRKPIRSISESCIGFRNVPHLSNVILCSFQWFTSCRHCRGGMYQFNSLYVWLSRRLGHNRSLFGAATIYPTSWPVSVVPWPWFTSDFADIAFWLHSLGLQGLRDSLAASNPHGAYPPSTALKSLCFNL